MFTPTDSRGGSGLAIRRTLLRPTSSDNKTEQGDTGTGTLQRGCEGGKGREVLTSV